MRNRYQRLLTAVQVVLSIVVASEASAEVVNPVVDFGEAYAKEGSRAAGNHVSAVGDELTIVGTVVTFNSPLPGPTTPGSEYTYIMTGMVSLGTKVSGSGSMLFYWTDYAGGAFRIYEDPAPNADWANPGTFTDGTPILEGTLSGFHISTQSFNCSGSQNADLQFTGGAWFDRVSRGGAGYTGIDTGLFSVCSNFVPAARQQQGYFGMSDTKIDVEEPVAATPSTWGRIKSRYWSVFEIQERRSQ